MIVTPSRRVRRTSPEGRLRRRLSFSRTWLRAGAAVLLAFAPLTLINSAQAASRPYTGANNGDWDVGTNWTGGKPGTTDDATNTTANTVIHSQNVIDTVNSVSFSGAGGLTLSGGTLAGSQASDGSTFSVAGIFLLSGGTLSNFSIANSNSLTFSSSSSNTLQNVALDAGLTLGDPAGALTSYVNIAGTVTHGASAAFNIGYNSFLNFSGNNTLDNANINFTSTSYYGFVQNVAGTTLTLGSGVTATGRAGQFNGSGALVNQGTINSNGGGGWFITPAQGFTNSGTVQATGASSAVTVALTGLVNTGVIKALNNGTVHLTNGTITTNNLGSLSATGGGAIDLEATVTNTGATLDPQAIGNFVLNGGTINGGTINNSNSLGFTNSSSNTLQNVTLGGTSGLTLGDPAGAFTGYVNIAGTLTNGVGANYNIGYNSFLNFTGNTTLNNANLNFTSTSYYGFVQNVAGTTLTLGSGVTATGRAAQFNGSGALVNQGTINSNGGGGWFVDPAQGVTNSGTIEATGTNSNLNLYLAGLTNTGTIKALTNGTVHLTNGTVTTTNLGAMSTSGGGAIDLEATLTNTGATLDPQAIGNFVLNGGTINGGTINNSNSLGFTNSSSSTLQNVTLGGTSGLTLGDPAGAFTGYVNIAGTLTNGAGAAFNIGYNSFLNFTGNTTLNNANINFTSTSYYGFVQNVAGTTLTLGSGVTATGRAGQFNGSGALVNQGTINSNGGGGWFVDPAQGVTNSGTIEATGTNSSLNLYVSGLVNTGTIKALTNGIVHLTNGTVTTTNLGAMSTSGGGAIDLEATLTNTGATLDPQAIGNFVLNGGTIVGGTIANSNSLGFTNSSSSTLQNVTLGGTSGLTLGDPAGAFTGYVNIAGTLTNGVGANYNIGYNSFLNFTGNTTLNNANINFTSTSYYGFVQNVAGTTLTLGSGVTATGRAGQFNGSGALVNQGTINSNGGGGWFVDPAQGVTNSGTIEATGTNSNLNLYLAGLTNTGTIKALTNGTVHLTNGTVTTTNLGAMSTSGGGAIDLEATVTNTGATLDPQAIGNFVLNGGTINGGTINNSNSLGFTNSSSSTLQNVTLGGTSGLTLGDPTGVSNGYVNIAGTLTNGSGAAFNIGYNSTLNFTSNNTLDNANINFTSTSYYGFVGNAAGTTLTLGSGVTATGRAGQFNGSGALVNQGTLNSNGGGAWFLNPAQGVTNNGTVQATGANSAVTVSTTTFTNNGTLQATGGANITLTSTGATPVAPVNTGAVIVSSGSTMTVNNALTQTAAGSTRIGGPLTQVDGTMTLTGSTAATNTLTIAGGVLDGVGTIKGNVVNTGGTVSPGDSPGTLTIASNGNSGTGNYTQGAGGTFTEELGGTTAGQFDVLSVAGAATLDGALSVSVVNNFAPTVGQSFAFLTYNNPTGNEGAFAIAISQNQGYAYNVTYSNLGAVLHVTAVPAPEPSQWAAFGLGSLGLAGLALRARRRQSRAV